MSIGNAPPQLKGTVERIIGDRGFCFIRGTNGLDYFAHYTEMRDGVRIAELQKGDWLTFKAVETPKGLRAIDITRTNP